MRNWEKPEELDFLRRVIEVLQEGGLLAPEALGLPRPLDLRGLAFPNVVRSKIADLAMSVVNKVAGGLEFRNATLRDSDLTNAQLSFSVWRNCTFERVHFDKAVLNHVRFSGCRLCNCSFRATDLRDASFSVDSNGAETEIIKTTFERANFRGASCNNPVFRSTSFVNCKLDGFVFNGALCDNLGFTGKVNELTFHGMPNDHERNRLRINLSHATIAWLNVDYGVDLEQVILPLDGSCMIIKSRLRAIDHLCSRLPKETGKYGSRVSKVLEALFSNRAMSPLEPSQDMILISKGMIADFAETNSMEVVDTLFDLVRSIAKSQGFLG